MSAATPKLAADRIAAYLAQTGRGEMTPTQRRRDSKKWHRRNLAELRPLTPRQTRAAGIRAARAARKASA